MIAWQNCCLGLLVDGKTPFPDQRSVFLHLAPAHLESKDRFSHPPNKSQVQVTNSQNFAFLSFHV
jgi:hypothetical protein